MSSSGPSRSFRKAVLRTLVCAIVLVVLPRLAAASPGRSSEDVPVPGGLTALARALGIEVPDRARCITEVVRLVYEDPRPRRDAKDSRALRLLAYLTAQVSVVPQASAAGTAARVRVRADAVVRSGLESGGVSTTRDAHRTLRGRDV